MCLDCSMNQHFMQKYLVVIQHDLPRRLLGFLWASSLDLWDIKTVSLEGFWREKASQGSSKQRKREFLEILKQPWFFSDFYGFWGSGTSLFRSFWKCCQKMIFNMNIRKKMTPACLRSRNLKKISLPVIQNNLPRRPSGPLWASSWDLWGTKVAPLKAFWMKKTSDEKNIPGRIKTRKKRILENPWKALVFNCFSGFSGFGRTLFHSFL